MENLIYRKALMGALSVSLVGIGVALFLQHGLSMAPCPLCVVQRLFLACVSFACLMALLVPQKLGRIVSAGAALLSLGGAGAAAWHLQEVLFPRKEASCAPGLGSWLDHQWTADIAPWFFSPSGDCFRDAANLLGIPLAAYAGVMFLVIAAFARADAINATKRGVRAGR